MNEIEIRSVSKTYNPGLFKRKIRALQDISLQISRGEVFGLIGPNGAGKSTTIRLLLGLSRPDTGSIHFRGKALVETQIQREIGYLPENPYLYDHLTLEELLDFSGRVSGLSSTERSRRGLELMEKLAMTEARKRPLRTFSKGMLQRAGICFALIHDPAIVILDEPMSGLDPIGRRMVFDLIGELKEKGRTVFFCSHILTDVERLCDRIGVMARGRLCHVLNKETFVQSPHPEVHLVVSRLSEEQRRNIGGLVSRIVDERDRHVISLKPAELLHLTQCLQNAGVEILASRGEGFSLEEIFMKTIEESL